MEKTGITGNIIAVQYKISKLSILLPLSKTVFMALRISLEYYYIVLIIMQLKEWQWRLDARLPDPFGRIGQWLAKAELLVSTNDVPTIMDDEAARILNTKIEDHKAFFSELPTVQQEFTAALSSPVVNEIPSDQLESMANRLNVMGRLASQRAVKLKFLEHKVSPV